MVEETATRQAMVKRETLDGFNRSVRSLAALANLSTLVSREELAGELERIAFDMRKEAAFLATVPCAARRCPLTGDQGQVG